MEYARCDSSHTVALPDGSYCYCRLDCGKPFAEFLPYAQAEVARVKAASIPTRASPLANASNRTAKPACPST